MVIHVNICKIKFHICNIDIIKIKRISIQEWKLIDNLKKICKIMNILTPIITIKNSIKCYFLQ